MLIVKNLEYEILREKIVRDFNLEVIAGKVVCLFGPSGCGKTSILRLITGLVNAKNGKILNTFAKTTYLFQENRLLEYKTALQNILITARCSEQKALNMLANLGLSKKDANKYPHELSGGMRARVSFARALLCEPDLLLMDEPFSGLDVDMRDVMMGEILTRTQHGMAILLVTHDRFEAVRLSDEIYFLEPKSMGVSEILRLDIPKTERNFGYINDIISQKFISHRYFD